MIPTRSHEVEGREREKGRVELGVIFIELTAGPHHRHHRVKNGQQQ